MQCARRRLLRRPTRPPEHSPGLEPWVQQRPFPPLPLPSEPRRGGRTTRVGWTVPQVGQRRGVWDSEAARVARATAASIARLSRKTAMMSTDSRGLGFFGFGDM